MQDILHLNQCRVDKYWDVMECYSCERFGNTSLSVNIDTTFRISVHKSPGPGFRKNEISRKNANF